MERGSSLISSERNKTMPDQIGHVVGQVGNVGGEVINAGKDALNEWRVGNGNNDADNEPYTPTSDGRIASIMGQPNTLPRDE